MQQITIAFDVDGTLLNDDETRPQIAINREIVELLDVFLHCFRNAKVIVWSGGGREYAFMQARKHGFDFAGIEYHDKNSYSETVDIAIDDHQLFALADKNLIVK